MLSDSPNWEIYSIHTYTYINIHKQFNVFVIEEVKILIAAYIFIYFSGMERYSFPHCRPLGVVGSTCRPKNFEPENVTVGYPDGNYVELTNIHKIMCPCAHGYVCNEQNMCYEPTEV